MNVNECCAEVTLLSNFAPSAQFEWKTSELVKTLDPLIS